MVGTETGMSGNKKPYNRGDAYEKTIFDILNSKGLTPKNSSRAGAGNGTDVVFLHNGGEFNLEVKNGKSADYGQSMIKWKDGRWEWSRDTDVTRFFNSLGMLTRLRRRGIVPIKFNKLNSSITVSDKMKDMRTFEEWVDIPLEALVKFYSTEKKCFYLQIGKKYGLYHLGRDIASLGTPKFDAEMKLRFRCKTIKSIPNSNYGFYAVLRVASIRNKSHLSIEPSKNQKFPPIKH